MADAYGDNLNQPEEALRFHRKAIEADPGNLGLRLALANRFKGMGRYDEALAECRAVVHKDPDLSAAYEAMSGIYAQLGRLDEAVRSQWTAVDKDPDAWYRKMMLFFRYLSLGDEAAAADIARRVGTMRPEVAYAPFVSAFLHLFRGEMEAAEKDARAFWQKSPDRGRDLVWGFDMRAGHAKEARDLYRSSNPELLEGADPRIGSANLGAAIRVAAAELKLGERQHAEMLLGKCAAYIGSRNDGTRRATYRSEPVQIHALMGRKDEALKALRQAIDDGFRPGSKPFLYDPTVDSIRDDPRFIAMVKEITADVDRMRRALAASPPH
jgi:tetratricopeptide (TPR) repeat protein